jgi:sensor histidine kinase regulating citrate/malate metabolism
MKPNALFAGLALAAAVAAFQASVLTFAVAAPINDALREEAAPAAATPASAVAEHPAARPQFVEAIEVVAVRHG